MDKLGAASLNKPAVATKLLTASFIMTKYFFLLCIPSDKGIKIKAVNPT